MAQGLAFNQCLKVECNITIFPFGHQVSYLVILRTDTEEKRKEEKKGGGRREGGKNEEQRRRAAEKKGKKKRASRHTPTEFC